MKTERWTHNDEHQLQQLLKRKAELLEKNTQPLLKVVKRLELQALTGSDKEIASALMAHADELRDALEPFDSGIREVVREAMSG